MTNKNSKAPAQGINQFRFLFTFLISLVLIEGFFHFFGPKQVLTEQAKQSAQIQHVRLPTFPTATLLPENQLDKDELALEALVFSNELHFVMNPPKDTAFTTSLKDSSAPFPKLIDRSKVTHTSLELISAPQSPVLLFTDPLKNSLTSNAEIISTLGSWLERVSIPMEDIVQKELFLYSPYWTTPAAFSADESGQITTQEIPQIDNKGALAYYRDGDSVVPFAFVAKTKYELSLTPLTSVLQIPPVLFQESVKSLVPSSVRSENYLTLENSSMQVVIDTKRGEILEVNLPYHSSATSSIRPVEIDRLLADTDHGMYPLHSSNTISDNKELVPFQQKAGGYYPLLRRAQATVPLLASLLDEKGQSVEPSSYQIKKIKKHEIVLEGKTASRVICKRFYLGEDLPPHTCTLDLDIQGDRSNLWLSSFALEAEANSSGVNELIKYRSLANEAQPEETRSLSIPKERKELNTLNAKWVLHSNGFFGTIIDPKFPITDLKMIKIPGEKAPSRYSLPHLPSSKIHAAKRHPWTQIQLKLPHDQQHTSLHFFAGPLSRDLLHLVDSKINQQNLDNGIAERIDYTSAIDFVGWFSFILRPFVSLMTRTFDLLYHFTQSWGTTLLLFTLLIRGLLFPLNSWSTRKMLHNQKVQPELAKLQKKYKKDPQTLRVKTMEFYKKEGINPLSGCLPMLIQLPFLFAMLNLLRHSVQLRGVTLVPGWINDLAAPDAIAYLPFSIPLLGNGVHLLPIILGLLTYAQAKISAPPITGNDKESKEKAQQQQMMAVVSSAMFTFFFYSLPSGLNLYWLIATLLGLLERLWIRSRVKN